MCVRRGLARRRVLGAEPGARRPSRRRHRLANVFVGRRGHTRPRGRQLFHFFYSRFLGGCGLLCWVNASECVRATGASAAGPFADAAVVSGVFCHNPTIRRVPDGTFVLFHIGQDDPGRVPACGSASYTCASNQPPPLPTDGRAFLTYMSAPHPAGPWTPLGRAAFTGNGSGWLGWVSNPSVHFSPTARRCSPFAQR